MKKIFILTIAIISSFFSFAQTNIPQLVSFSAVVRDANNQLLVNTPVSIRLTFKQGGQNGPLVYCALHQDSTNSNGFISIQLNRDVLGTGCNGAPSTAFENIPWQNGGFWMEVEYQTIASSPFVNLGQLELASSFYAFAAGTAERITNFNLNGIQNGDVMVYNSTNQMFEPGQSGITSVQWANVQNKPTVDTSFTNELQTLSISNDTIYLTGGGFVKLPATSTGAMLAPTTTNQAVSNLQSFSATLNGTVNANGLSSTVVFEWGLTTTYGNVANVSQSPVTGTTAVAINANLTGLQSNTTYHYRIKATNAVNVTYSNDMSFTTSLSAPQLSTTAISSILAFSAITGGNVTYDGGSPVTTRGVCYSTSPTPTTANNIMASGTGSGAFVSNLTGLTHATTYYARAYATNAVGTTYGNELTFTTQNGIIVLTTTAITDRTTTTATSGANITADGGSPVTARGVCWSTNTSPTLANVYTSNSTGTGSFVSNITGLTINTTYYLRAYATNAVGTTYGNEITFNTGIGASYQGGIIAYFLQPGDNGYVAGQLHGLIAAPSDQSSGATWGCYGTTITGADSTSLGYGNQNTIDIITGCTTAGIAAKLCYDLVLNGYSDWYLPSKDELNKLYTYLKLNNMGGFAGDAYWSSSEGNAGNAWRQNFVSGTQGNYYKDGTNYVRAVRAF